MEPKYLYYVADVKNKTVCLLLAVKFAFPAKSLATFELPRRPQGAVAVCTDCAVLAPGTVNKDQGLEGFGQCLGTGVLK